ncbi:MAG: ADP-ribosylation factor-like protein [Candidatus Heimdallarchaeaceae archaeon]
MSYLEEEIEHEDKLIKGSENGDFGLKLLFLGLAQTGKSSIIQVIFENRSPETTKEIQATLGVRRKLLEFSNLSLNVYDVGGQITYLEEAFIDLRESIFSHIKTLFFVVDASKYHEFSFAKNYFERAIKNLSEYSPDAKLIVLSHKSDLIPKEERAKAVGVISELFEIESYPNVEIHETSIFEPTLSDAIKKAIQ